MTGRMRVLLLLACAWSGIASASIREVRPGEPVDLPEGHGLLVLAVDTGRPLHTVGIRRNDRLFGAEAMRAVPVGDSQRLYMLPEGSYRWDYIRDAGIRYTVSERDAYSFSVRAGVLNYPGHMVYRQLGDRRMLAHVANRASLVMDWLREAHAALAATHALEYRGHYPDPFPAFYLARSGGPPPAAATAPVPQAPAALPLPVQTLWRPVELELVDLNPRGDLVAVVSRRERDGEARWLLQLIDLETEEATAVLESPREISRIDWSGDRALVVSCSEADALDSVLVLHVRGEGQARRYERFWFPYKGMLVDPLPDDPGHVLFASVYVGEAASGVQVHRVPISARRDLERYRFSRGTALDRSLRQPRQWLVDGSGALRAAIEQRDERLVLLHGRDGAFEEVLSLDDTEAFAPLGLSADGNLIYGVSGQDREQRDLVEFDPATRRITRVLFSRPLVDVQDALFDGRHALVGASYYEDGLLVSDYFDDTSRAIQARLQAAFPGRMVRIMDRDAASAHFLLLVGGSDQPSQVYHFEAAANRASLLLETAPWLEGRRFRPSQVVRATAGDGFPIEAYLTLPEAAHPPLVVLAHGGPIGVRDTRYFDREVQFLASLGYAVLQVNFRGSEGYGRRFREAGKRHYGGLIEDDIDAVLAQVLATRAVDRERMCAMGSSYGGYSALVSAIRWPGRFRCVVSIAGISDRVLFFTASDAGRSREGREALEEIIGHPVADAEEMRQYSPLYRYEELEVPVLLAHGTEDLRVDFEHTRRLSRMLSMAGRPPVLLALEGEGHALEGQAANARLWEAVAGFLHAHLAPVAPAGTDAPAGR